MYLINEKHIIVAKRSQYTGKIAGLVEHRTGSDLEIHPELIGYDTRKRRLAKPRRTEQEQMVQSLTAHAGSLDKHLQILYNLLLTVERIKIRRPQSLLKLLVRIRPVMYIKFGFHMVYKSNENFHLHQASDPYYNAEP